MAQALLHGVPVVSPSWAAEILALVEPTKLSPDLRQFPPARGSAQTAATATASTLEMWDEPNLQPTPRREELVGYMYAFEVPSLTDQGVSGMHYSECIFLQFNCLLALGVTPARTTAHSKGVTAVL